MKEYIEERAMNIANYIIENNATVRQRDSLELVSVRDIRRNKTERFLWIVE